LIRGEVAMETNRQLQRSAAGLYFIDVIQLGQFFLWTILAGMSNDHFDPIRSGHYLLQLLAQ
jgi:hypothetical protein